MTTIDASPLSRATRSVLRRWPTLLALALLALVADPGSGLDDLAPTLMLLPTAYVLALSLGRRWTWPLVAAGIAASVVCGALGVDQRGVLLAVAAAGLGVAVVRGRARREVVLQAVGLLVFGGAAVVAASTSPTAATWLVAAAWFAHGVWDFVHLHRDAVVTRSFAEWCGVVDVLVAAMIVLSTTSWVA